MSLEWKPQAAVNSASARHLNDLHLYYSSPRTLETSYRHLVPLKETFSFGLLGRILELRLCSTLPITLSLSASAITNPVLPTSLRHQAFTLGRAPALYYFPSSELHFLTCFLGPWASLCPVLQIKWEQAIHPFGNYICLLSDHCNPATQPGHGQMTCAALNVCLSPGKDSGLLFL